MIDVQKYNYKYRYKIAYIHGLMGKAIDGVSREM